MEITVSGRKCEVTGEFRDQVEEKLSKIERIDERVDRVLVQVCREHNPRRASEAERVELTFHTTRGTVVRAEASAADRLAALDAALDRLSAQVRRYRDRRKVHRGRHAPVSVAQATAALPTDGMPVGVGSPDPTADPMTDTADDVVPHREMAGVVIDGDGPLVVREKTHAASPMSVENALEQMELVGHDFFLFVDERSMLPSVVYRRRGYDFGLIRLADMTVRAAPAADPSAQVDSADRNGRRALVGKARAAR